MYTSLISTEQLAAHLDDEHWLVFDCRFTLTDVHAGKKAYEKDHIPGAIYADLEQDLSAAVTETSGRHPLPDRDTLARTLSQWGFDRQKQVVVYDDIFGSIAARMWWLLKWLGHDNVALLNGGYPKWKREQRPLENTAPEPSATGFTCTQTRDNMVVTSEEVTAAMDENESIIIDVRAEERFEGIHEPIDRIAGHIPGAINHPYDENLDISGEYLPTEELRPMYQNLLKDHVADKTIMMCGSGVTACHNLIAMEHLGLKGAKLYVGSWSQWITDPTRPIVNEADQ